MQTNYIKLSVIFALLASFQYMHSYDGNRTKGASYPFSIINRSNGAIKISWGWGKWKHPAEDSKLILPGETYKVGTMDRSSALYKFYVRFYNSDGTVEVDQGIDMLGAQAPLVPGYEFIPEEVYIYGDVTTKYNQLTSTSPTTNNPEQAAQLGHEIAMAKKEVLEKGYLDGKKVWVLPKGSLSRFVVCKSPSRHRAPTRMFYYTSDGKVATKDFDANGIAIQ